MQEIEASILPGRRRAQTAIRAAEALGLISVRERRVSAFRSDNIIVVISQECRVWLRLADKGGGCKKDRRTQFQDSTNEVRGRNSPRPTADERGPWLVTARVWAPTGNSAGVSI